MGRGLATRAESEFVICLLQVGAAHSPLAAWGQHYLSAAAWHNHAHCLPDHYPAAARLFWHSWCHPLMTRILRRDRDRGGHGSLHQEFYSYPPPPLAPLSALAFGVGGGTGTGPGYGSSGSGHGNSSEDLDNAGAQAGIAVAMLIVISVAVYIVAFKLALVRVGVAETRIIPTHSAIACVCPHRSSDSSWAKGRCLRPFFLTFVM